MIIDDMGRLINDRDYYLKRLKIYSNLCDAVWIIALCIIFFAILFEIKARLIDVALLIICWCVASAFLFFRGLQFYAARSQQLTKHKNKTTAAIFTTTKGGENDQIK